MGGCPSHLGQGPVQRGLIEDLNVGAETGSLPAYPLKNMSIKKYFLSAQLQDSGHPGNSPRTTASLPFRNISSRPCSPAVRTLGSQDDVVYCFNICLTQGKPFSSDSLSVICISGKEISRQIRCLGAHHGMRLSAIGGLLQE